MQFSHCPPTAQRTCQAHHQRVTDIESFAGITQLPRLQVLNVENNNLTSLAGLSSSSLVSLSVANNDLTTLSGLHGATALRCVEVAVKDAVVGWGG